MWATKKLGLTSSQCSRTQHFQIRSQRHLNWELFDHYPLNGANFYRRYPYGLRSANAIKSSRRPACNKSEQYLCA